MNNNDEYFHIKKVFDDAIGNLGKELDKYITGEWKRIDYDLENTRSEVEFSRDGVDDDNITSIKVSFGDRNTLPWHKLNLVIKYKKEFTDISNKLIIEEIFPTIYDNETNCQIICEKFERAYDSSVKELIGYEIIGKSNKELTLDKIKFRKEEAVKKEHRLVWLKNEIADTRSDLIEIYSEINKLEKGLLD